MILIFITGCGKVQKDDTIIFDISYNKNKVTIWIRHELFEDEEYRYLIPDNEGYVYVVKNHKGYTGKEAIDNNIIAFDDVKDFKYITKDKKES